MPSLAPQYYRIGESLLGHRIEKQQRRLGVIACMSFAFGLLLTPASHAEVGFGVRDSALEFEWLYGQAGDVRMTAGSDNPARPLLSDGAGLVGGMDVQDPGYPYLGEWSASASWVVVHGYAVQGTRDDMESMAATGYSKADATGTNCTSILTDEVNRLRLEFTVGGDVGSSTDFLWRVMFNESQGSASAIARIDTLTQFGWTAVGIASSDGTTSHLQSLSLGPGLYRFEGSAYARATAGTNPASEYSQYQMSLTVSGFNEPELIPTSAVPEPTVAAMLLLGLSGAALCRRR